LEKLFGVGSFGGFIDHMVHYQAIFLISLGELDLPFIVQTIVRILGMLGSDHSCIYHSFPTG
jgi:hypothetical protein